MWAEAVRNAGTGKGHDWSVRARVGVDVDTNTNTNTNTNKYKYMKVDVDVHVGVVVWKGGWRHNTLKRDALESCMDGYEEEWVIAKV